jgi:hypothetical protein
MISFLFIKTFDVEVGIAAAHVQRILPVTIIDRIDYSASGEFA